MIIVEKVDNDTRERRYSDKNVMLRQVETGILYEDAVDVIPCRYTYEESDVPIESITVAETNPITTEGNGEEVYARAATV